MRAICVRNKKGPFSSAGFLKRDTPLCVLEFSDFPLSPARDYHFGNRLNILAHLRQIREVNPFLFYALQECLSLSAAGYLFLLGAQGGNLQVYSAAHAHSCIFAPGLCQFDCNETEGSQGFSRCDSCGAQEKFDNEQLQFYANVTLERSYRIFRSGI